MSIDILVKEIRIYLVNGGSQPAAALLVSLGAAMVDFHLPAGRVLVCRLGGWKRVSGARSSGC